MYFGFSITRIRSLELVMIDLGSDRLAAVQGNRQTKSRKVKTVKPKSSNVQLFESFTSLRVEEDSP